MYTPNFGNILYGYIIIAIVVNLILITILKMRSHLYNQALRNEKRLNRQLKLTEYRIDRYGK